MCLLMGYIIFSWFACNRKGNQQRLFLKQIIKQTFPILFMQCNIFDIADFVSRFPIDI